MDKTRQYDEAFARANELYKRREYEEAAKHAREAVRLAGEMGITGDNSSAAMLLELIEDNLRAMRIAATGDIGKMLHDLGTIDWPQAQKALKSIGEPAVSPLSKLVTDSSGDVKRRGLAASVLADIAGPRAIDSLLVLLQDKRLRSDKYATKNTIFALENLHDPRIAEAVRPFLQDRDEDLKAAAEIVLEKYGVRRKWWEFWKK